MGLKPLAMVALATCLAGCAHTRGPRDGDAAAKRSRRVRISDDVTVVATRWDAPLVEATVTELPPAQRKPARGRMLERYVDGRTAFTVLLELGNLPAEGDGPGTLADAKTWWFRLQSPGRSLSPESVEVMAVDRFPGTDGRGHVRMALLVVFDQTDLRRTATLRVGSRAKQGRRPILGPKANQEGLALRWQAAVPRSR